jgi:hypothetical protein
VLKLLGDYWQRVIKTMLMKWLGLLCFITCIGCNNLIPDQDGVISIKAKDSYEAWTSENGMVECSATAVADTIVAYLSYKVVSKNNQPMSNEHVIISSTKFSSSVTTNSEGIVKFDGIPAGTYSIQVGNTNVYPCILLHSLQVGTGHMKAFIFHLPK